MNYKKMLLFVRGFHWRKRQTACVGEGQSTGLKRILLLSIMCGFAITGMGETASREGWFAIYPNIYVPCLPAEVATDAPAPVLHFRIAEWFGRT